VSTSRYDDLGFSVCPKSEVQTVKIIASLFYTLFSKFTDIVSLVAELNMWYLFACSVYGFGLVVCLGSILVSSSTVKPLFIVS